MKNPKLFAVYLGGRAEGCNIELHDVVFTVGEKIEDCYEDLLEKWFGLPEKMHLDSWMILDIVDGYRVTLHPKADTSEKRLYFINMGAYKEGHFTEFHENAFLVDTNPQTVKKRALTSLMKSMDKVHKDDLYDVDDCIEIASIKGYHVHLQETDEDDRLIPHNDYHKVPKARLQNFLNR